MLKKILIILVVLVATCSVKADIIFDTGHNVYNDSNGYNFEVWVINEAILDVLSGEIGKLETENLAITNLYGGNIDWLFTNDNTVANIHGGNFEWVGAWENSVINLTAYEVLYHATGGLEDRSWVSGIYLADNSPFSFTLYMDQAYQHINIVPEPTTLLLFGLGGLFIRKRN